MASGLPVETAINHENELAEIYNEKQIDLIKDDFGISFSNIITKSFEFQCLLKFKLKGAKILWNEVTRRYNKNNKKKKKLSEKIYEICNWQYAVLLLMEEKYERL